MGVVVKPAPSQHGLVRKAEVKVVLHDTSKTCYGPISEISFLCILKLGNNNCGILEDTMSVLNFHSKIAEWSSK